MRVQLRVFDIPGDADRVSNEIRRSARHCTRCSVCRQLSSRPPICRQARRLRRRRRRLRGGTARRRQEADGAASSMDGLGVRCHGE